MRNRKFFIQANGYHVFLALFHGFLNGKRRVARFPRANPSRNLSCPPATKGNTEEKQRPPATTRVTRLISIIFWSELRLCPLVKGPLTRTHRPLTAFLWLLSSGLAPALPLFSSGFTPLIWRGFRQTQEGLFRRHQPPPRRPTLLLISSSFSFGMI